MQLTTILLYAVAVLTMLTGFATLVGSRRNERLQSAFFMLTAIGAAGWGISIATFQALEPNQTDFAPIPIMGIYICAILMDIGFLGYSSGQLKLGRILTGLFAIAGAVMIGLIVYNPDWLYSSFTLSNTGNSVQLVDGWYYYLYLVYFMSITPAFLAILIYRILKTRNKGQRTGLNVLLVGSGITGVLSLIFDLLLPFWVRYDLIWIGPLTISITMIAHYYSILRYKVLPLSTTWLRILSYGILMLSTAIIYMVIFFMVFTALFKVPNPSPSIFILNFIMVAIILLMMPVINESTAFIRSLVQTDSVDLAYVVRKLNQVASNKSVNLNELADFLATYLHFNYIGLFVRGRLYGSSSMPITVDELKQISLLGRAEKGVWQEFNQPVAEIVNRLGIKAVAELNDDKGKAFGQVLVGKPTGKMGFDRKDLAQLEMIINIVAMIAEKKK